MTEEGCFDGGTAQPGPLVEEAAKLIGAAQEWLHRRIGDDSIATGSAECCWCPLCQLVATLRGERPELAERFAEVQTTLTGLFRVVADGTTGRYPGGRGAKAAGSNGSGSNGSGFNSPNSETSTGSPPRVQPIQFDDDDLVEHPGGGA